MYVRLKHTLSTLALRMLQRTPRRRPIAWLLAYVRLAPQGQTVSLQTLRREATRLGTASAGGLAYLEALGLLERVGDMVRLAPEYVENRTYFARQVRRLAAALQAIDRARGSDRRAGMLTPATFLFNAGLFFECHEYLEDVWRGAEASQRDFYHGLIQAAAALYHFEKGNLHGTTTLLAKALRRLETYRPAFLGVDVERLVADLRRWQRRCEARRPGRPLCAQEFPQIRSAARMVPQRFPGSRGSG
ncbi:MAG: DUF309 domain-containing protein [Armatimonadota bacterium]|nr:DUF309 domain-containing protein [Armatimonadota bacterium]MDR7427611.1 DUF309 domain-containing protein [Armatimonadota bacterium]MDR7469579.1 DUF309 domain-containing protein [Armatimonadota bacterium]MDR7475832.1 DUF309 domain-containing protein [Armatimonadota bacterium]MDR7538299.1 DUF309 domain-containing protein [Armatimonadota bacterium]